MLGPYTGLVPEFRQSRGRALARCNNKYGKNKVQLPKNKQLAQTKNSQPEPTRLITCKTVWITKEFQVQKQVEFRKAVQVLEYRQELGTFSQEGTGDEGSWSILRYLGHNASQSHYE